MRNRMVWMVLGATLLTLALAGSASADCYTYASSVVYAYAPYEYACIGGGGTCRECGQYNNGGYGFMICWDAGPGSPNVICVDYQGTMGFGF